MTLRPPSSVRLHLSRVSTSKLTLRIESAAKLLNEICASEDDAFMVGLLEAIVQKDPAGYTSKHNYKISNPTDWKAVKAMGTPGPHFSLRLAGGAYRFANNGLGLSELFVNSSTGTIHGTCFTLSHHSLRSIKINRRQWMVSPCEICKSTRGKSPSPPRMGRISRSSSSARSFLETRDPTRYSKGTHGQMTTKPQRRPSWEPSSTPGVTPMRRT